MKKRLPYIITFFLLLTAEMLIGLFVRDAFIRPYVGDILVTVLLCSLVKIFLVESDQKLPLLVFLFSAAIELLQLFQLPERLGLEGTALGIALGSTFDWTDLVCYLIGCILFAAAEAILQKK